jgi:hypothetical protein
MARRSGSISCVLKTICLGLVAMAGLNGCALTTPSLRATQANGDFEEGLSEERLVVYIKCSVGEALSAVLTQNQEDQRRYGSLAPLDPAPWLADWGAQVSLKVTVDENSNLSPGLTYKVPLANSVTSFPNGNVTVARSWALPLSASATAEATRTESFQLYLYFPDIISDFGPNSPKCKPDGQYFIHGDLKIGDFIVNKVRLAQAPGLLPGRPTHVSPLDAFTYETTFIVTTSGGVNPTWTLSRFIVDPGSGNLIGASRKRTDDLIITVGPTDHSKDCKPPEPAKPDEAAKPAAPQTDCAPQPTVRAQAAHNAALIGQAIH